MAQPPCGPNCHENNSIHIQPNSPWYCAVRRCGKQFPYSEIQTISTVHGPASVCPFCHSEDIFATCKPEIEAAEAEFNKQKAHRDAMTNSGYNEE